MSDFFTKILLNLRHWSGSTGSFNLAKSGLGSSDFLLGIFLAVAVLVIAFGSGKTRILLAILASYLAAFLALVFPFSNDLAKIIQSYLKLRGMFWGQLAVFVVAFAVAFWLLNRSVLKPRLSLKESSPFVILILSILETGFLASLLVSYWQKDPTVFKISPWLTAYFSGKIAQFVWAVLPLFSFLGAKPVKRLPVI